MDTELHPLSLERLLEWILREQAGLGTVFGLHEDLWLTDLAGRPTAMTRYGRTLETPFGVAAGPHSQLSQNIVAAWLCGARFVELKTVQVLDELDIPRPCIDMADEGYNCEWSQELPIGESFAQYADAWTAIQMLRHQAGTYDPTSDGYVFNISVGYDLAGIKTAKVGRFLDLMQGSRGELKDRLARAARYHRGCRDIVAPESLSDNVTLSTMHGCPPDEIERIGRYLIEERGLHTAVKLNPTLLGKEALRELLCGKLGYEVDVPDAAFEHDLEFGAALDIIRSLQGAAHKCGVEFAVKLTNTLECRNTRDVFPPNEDMMYMSGRALHPITAQVAARLDEALDGSLDMSFSGGADWGNAAELVACGLTPVTVCSDLLRPGGYQRLNQYMDVLETAMTEAGATDLDAFTADSRARLQAYAARVADDPRYRQDHFGDRTIKTDRPLEAYDCVDAPCVVHCPTRQDVPEYMTLTARGEYEAALSVVLRDNPFPAVTGMVCDHPCLERCTRVNYEGVVGIRDIKRFLAHRADGAPPAVPAAPSGKKVAVIGAGPAGLTCGWYLALAGADVSVLEAKGFPGGMITDAIPSFRLSESDFATDLARIEAAGVDVCCGESVDAERFAALRADHDAVFVGVGAQADRELGIPGGDLPGVVPALGFLSRALQDPPPELKGDVAVIGGGNTAMDAARTAVRLLGDGSRVHIIYRRTVAEMPADREEIRAVRAEGVTIHELLAPAAVTSTPDGRWALECEKMRLGEPDQSGRRRPESIPGAADTLVFDTIFPAIGQKLDCDFLGEEDLVVSGAGLETSLSGVWAGGDARRGPASLIDAIADGKEAAKAILASFGVDALPKPAPAPRDFSPALWQKRAATLVPAVLPSEHLPAGRGDFDLVIGELTELEARAEASRCLDCSTICDVCVTVCPNRANIGYDIVPRLRPLMTVERNGEDFTVRYDGIFDADQRRQTANIVDFCNHCGDCTTFCPTAGEPYLDKPRIALTEETYHGDDRVHLIELGEGHARISYRDNGREESLVRREDGYIFVTPEIAVEMGADLAVSDVRFLTDADEVSLHRAASLAVLLDALIDSPYARVIPEGEGK
ncbi:MAG: putative selenate reductase subunit YgfK [bacterium]|nr:putative selenate reductase subunit YgfK [bacterium]